MTSTMEVGRVKRIGTCAALGIGRLAASQISGVLFGLSAGDARAIVAAILIQRNVAALAALVPARRAGRSNAITS